MLMAMPCISYFVIKTFCIINFIFNIKSAFSIDALVFLTMSVLDDFIWQF